MIIASAIMWSEFFKAEGRPRLTLEEFWYMYKQEKRRDGAWNLHSRIPGRKLVDLPGRVSSLKGVESKFFFVSGEGGSTQATKFGTELVQSDFVVAGVSRRRKVATNCR
jgi:hypothetical protein